MLGFAAFRSDHIRAGEIAMVYVKPAIVGSVAALVTLLAIQLMKLAGCAPFVQLGFGALAGLIAAAVAARVFMPATWSEMVKRTSQLFAHNAVISPNALKKVS
jgi:predicted exporter